MRRLLKISCRTEAQSSRLSIAKVMTCWRARRAYSVRITVYTTFIMADSARKLVRAAWKEARKASIALRLLLFTTQARPQSLKMASPSDNSSDSNAIPLTENDIPGASLLGRKPKALKNSELKFWLKCRGDTRKGLKTSWASETSVRVHTKRQGQTDHRSRST